MRILLRAKNLEEANAWKGVFERKLAFAVDRHQDRLAEIAVSLVDLNGPRGGPDKHCHIKARFRDGRTVSIEERGDDMMALAARGVKRLTHHLGKLASRARQRRAPVRERTSEEAT
ncbi:MAG: hypothetical protein FJW39_35635 [Acidobacteria bacterium]|nr:hypothetical protein [Acidobacteriota bacterium]